MLLLLADQGVVLCFFSSISFQISRRITFPTLDGHTFARGGLTTGNSEMLIMLCLFRYGLTEDSPTSRSHARPGNWVDEQIEN